MKKERMELEVKEEDKRLEELCRDVKVLLENRQIEACENEIEQAMGRYPHSAIPHNLIGILLEKQQKHVLAMKHFRAAWALDPTYTPARCNMDNFTSFNWNGKCYFSEKECPEDIKKDLYKIEYDENGVQNLVRR